MKWKYTFLSIFILVSLGCSTLLPGTPTATLVSAPSKTPRHTPTPEAAFTPTSEAALDDLFGTGGNFSRLVVLDGFTVEAPLETAYEDAGYGVFISEEKYFISIIGSSYDGATPLEDEIDGYLTSTARNGITMDRSEPYEITVDNVVGLGVDVTADWEGIEATGRAFAVSPRPDFFLFGFGMAQQGDSASDWDDVGKGTFESMVASIHFIDAAVDCEISEDNTYGFTPENPIQVGGDVFTGPSRERAYLDTLRGPEGQSLTYERSGSIPEGDTILDIYMVTGPGIEYALYIDMYQYKTPMAPVGFTCEGPFPLSEP